MIKNISPIGAFTQVSSYYPPNIYNNGQGAGNVRYNTSTQAMEVYDGNSWINISQTATISLSMSADEAIRWTLEKMTEERDLKARMEKHPGLKDAYEKFQLLDILTKEEDVKSSS